MGSLSPSKKSIYLREESPKKIKIFEFFMTYHKGEGGMSAVSFFFV